ncbi:hypothetical protein [Mucilaginibacter sp.]|uniref:hypothetical protein n=1 Tax=Mucilaginibacter sp. TaxID=1882438 RepID=UPI0035BC34B1
MPHKLYSSRKKLKLIPVYYLIVILGGLIPLIFACLAGYIADINGCILNEAGVNPCQVGGVDIGDLLSMMFVSGWFMLITVPGALLVFVVLTYYTVHDIVFYRNNKDDDYDTWLSKIQTKR